MFYHMFLQFYVQVAAVDSDWRSKARPIQSGSSYPAKEFCSHCGLCDTYYVAHVKDACAFLGDGEGRVPAVLAGHVTAHSVHLHGTVLSFHRYSCSTFSSVGCAPAALFAGPVVSY